MRWWRRLLQVLLAGALCLAAGLRGQDRAGDPTADDIIARLCGRLRETATQPPASGYECRRETVIEELGSRGQVTERKTKEHHVICEAGATAAKLQRLNGRIPSPREARADEQRDEENRRQYAERRPAPGRTPDFLDDALVRRFDYVLLGSETLEGRLTHRLAFRPKTGLDEPDTIADRVVNSLVGELWVDAEEAELVRVEARLRAPLTVFGGVVASIQTMDFSLFRHRLAAGLWANRSFGSRLEGRKLFAALRVRVRVEQTEFALRPAAATASSSP
jgi:hypothetical protein